MATVENVIVTGKSGAGKQPRIDVLVKEFGLTQLSTGNIFRHYLSLLDGLPEKPDFESFWDAGSDWFVDDNVISDAIGAQCEQANIDVQDAVLACKVSRFVLGGMFVPDRITNELFQAAFEKRNFEKCALDGYPRTPQQSQFLLDLLKQNGKDISFVLLVDAEDDAIVERLSGRRICPNGECGKVYHLEFKPPVDGKYCKACNSEVILRADDTEEKIRKRLQEFADKAKPALHYLQEKDIKVAKVPGNLPEFSEEAVRVSVMGALADIGF